MKNKSRFWLVIALIIINGLFVEQVYSQDNEPVIIREAMLQIRSNVSGVLRSEGGNQDASLSVLLSTSEVSRLQNSGKSRYYIDANKTYDNFSFINIHDGSIITLYVRDEDGNRIGQSDPITIQRNRNSYQFTINRIQQSQTNVAPQTQTQVIQPQVPPAESFEVEQLANNTLAITDYNGTIRDIIIPDTLYGLKVTEIKGFIGVRWIMRNNKYYYSWKILQNARNIRSIRFPDTVIKIGDANILGNGLVPDHFIGNDTTYGLYQVTLGSTVRIIGDYTFYDNPNLTEIIIPNSVTEIGIYAFGYCGLKSVNLPSGLKRISSYAFANNNIQSVSIPAGVEFVENYIFSGNPITRATLPANLSNDVMQRWGLETGLVNFYANQNRAAGTYVKNGPIWSRQ